MANTIGWGKAVENNTNGFGKLATNTIGAGAIYESSASGETALLASSVQEEFIFRVDTTLPGATPSNQFQIKTTGGPYNYDVDWGDGQTDTGVTSSTGISHTYDTGGEYDIKISGTFPQIFYNNNSEGDKITEIKNWGIIQWSSFDRAFMGCNNLDLTATDYPDLTNCTTLHRIFNGCSSFENTNGSIGGWDTSTITNMDGVFAGCVLFNQSINNWDVSNVTSFGPGFNRGMFTSCFAFNQPLNNWDVSSCTRFNQMFQNCYAFNQDLSSWRFHTTLNVGFGSMFKSATSFNNGGQDGIKDWNTNMANSFSGMFYGASSFNQPLTNWNTSNVAGAGFKSMFRSNTSFNQDISHFDVSNGTDFREMFRSATSFNNGGQTGINNWSIKTTGNVLMSSMFFGATSFNQPIGNWDVSAVSSFQNFLYNATSFNQNVTNLISTIQGPSNLVTITYMFSDSEPTADWTQFPFQYVNGSALRAFRSVNDFDQNVSNWQIPSTVSNMSQMFASTGLSNTDFTDTVVGWAVYIYNNGGVPSGINFSGNGKTFDGTRTSDDESGQTYAVKYGANWTATGWTDAQDAFDYLVTTLNWSI